MYGYLRKSQKYLVYYASRPDRLTYQTYDS